MTLRAWLLAILLPLCAIGLWWVLPSGTQRQPVPRIAANVSPTRTAPAAAEDRRKQLELDPRTPNGMPAIESEHELRKQAKPSPDPSPPASDRVWQHRRAQADQRWAEQLTSHAVQQLTKDDPEQAQHAQELIETYVGQVLERKAQLTTGQITPARMRQDLKTLRSELQSSLSDTLGSSRATRLRSTLGTAVPSGAW